MEEPPSDFNPIDRELIFSSTLINIGNGRNTPF
jgi:hypothetical protein